MDVVEGVPERLGDVVIPEYTVIDALCFPGEVYCDVIIGLRVSIFRYVRSLWATEASVTAQFGDERGCIAGGWG